MQDQSTIQGVAFKMVENDESNFIHLFMIIVMISFEQDEKKEELNLFSS